MSRAPWQNPRIVYTLLFVFLSGAAAGALAMRFTASPAARYRNGPSWKEGSKEISLQKFRKELNLTPEQEREMETVLDDFVTYYQTLQAQMDDVRATGKQRILRILKDDQKQKFEKMIGELQNKPLR
jgi:Spy/CpxP family protein refolding chaperone